MLAQHLEKLIHFVGVVNCGSIRRYAISKGLSQPAISKSILNLESVLETVLFTRDRQGITLTGSGKILFEWADELLQASRNIESEIRGEERIRLKGTLKIGCYPSIGVYFLPKLFKFIQNRQSDLKPTFISGSSQDLIKQLKSSHVDLIISIDPPIDLAIANTVLFQDTFSIFRSVSTQWTEETAPIFSLPSARDSSGKSISSHVSAYKCHGQLYTCGDFEGAKAMLEADSGFAILPERVAMSLLASKSIERVVKWQGLIHFGGHKVVLSCKKSRKNERNISWIAQQIQTMLGTKESLI